MGGTQASRASWTDVCEHQSALARLPGLDESRSTSACSRAIIDLELIQKYFSRAPKRRGVPVWALPQELWHICIGTPTAHAASNARAGLGADRNMTDGRYSKLLLHRVFASIRYWGVVPKLWDFNQ
eukprot:6849744-Pyramimonas_sp.AAC.1